MLVERNLWVQGSLRPGVTELWLFRVTKEKSEHVLMMTLNNTCFKDLAFIPGFIGDGTNPFSENSNTIMSSFLCPGKSIPPCYHRPRVKRDVFASMCLSPCSAPSTSLPFYPPFMGQTSPYAK